MAFAEDWYLDLRGKARAGLLPKGKLFRDAAAEFLREYEDHHQRRAQRGLGEGARHSVAAASAPVLRSLTDLRHYSGQSSGVSCRPDREPEANA
ncbi:MAG: hypothetical protein WDM89_19555 [Rhizomicrobium sp.]